MMYSFDQRLRQRQDKHKQGFAALHNLLVLPVSQEMKLAQRKTRCHQSEEGRCCEPKLVCGVVALWLDVNRHASLSKGMGLRSAAACSMSAVSIYQIAQSEAA